MSNLFITTPVMGTINSNVYIDLTVRLANGMEVIYGSSETLYPGMRELTDTQKEMVETLLGRPMQPARSGWCRLVDLYADEVRIKQKAAGHMSIDIEYKRVEKEYEDWIAIGSPTNDIPESVQSWIDARNIMGVGMQQALAEIDGATAMFNDIIEQVRRVRVNGKALLKTCPWDEISTHYGNTLSALDAISLTIPNVFES